MSDGLLTRWHNSQTMRMPAAVDFANQDTVSVASIAMLDTVQVNAVTSDCVKLPIVRPIPDELTWSEFANSSINVWLIACFWIMFFVLFAALLWMLGG